MVVDAALKSRLLKNQVNKIYHSKSTQKKPTKIDEIFKNYEKTASVCTKCRKFELPFEKNDFRAKKTPKVLPADLRAKRKKNAPKKGGAVVYK